jgi:hypothetical protein
MILVGIAAREKCDWSVRLNNFIDWIESSRPKPILRVDWAMWIFD